MLKAARMARAALRLSKVALVASSVTGAAAFFTWWYVAVVSMAMVNDCCSPGPAVPGLLTAAVLLLEILSSVAVALAIAAFVQWRLERRPPDCGKRATLAFVFGVFALAIAVTSDICLR